MRRILGYQGLAPDQCAGEHKCAILMGHFVGHRAVLAKIGKPPLSMMVFHIIPASF